MVHPFKTFNMKSMGWFWGSVWGQPGCGTANFHPFPYMNFEEFWAYPCRFPGICGTLWYQRNQDLLEDSCPSTFSPLVMIYKWFTLIPVASKPVSNTTHLGLSYTKRISKTICFTWVSHDVFNVFQPWRFPFLWGCPYEWMVYVMENPIYQWMTGRGLTETMPKLQRAPRVPWLPERIRASALGVFSYEI